MKTKALSMVVGAWMVCAVSVVADEYGYFSRTTEGDFSKVVTLREGDTLTILSIDGVYGNIPWYLVLTLPDGNQIKLDSTYDLNFGGSIEQRRIICGPCSVSIDKYNSSCLYIAYKIVRASDNSIKPSNVIVLPADVDGDMQLVFESSDDLLTWDQGYSFTHNSTNQTSKFFRTRLIHGSGE